MDLRITVLFVLALVFVGTEAPAPPGCQKAGVSGQRPPGCGSQIGKKENKLLNTLLERLLVRELEAEVAEEQQALKKKAMDNPQAPAETREFDTEQAQELRDLDADEKQEEETRLLNLLLGLNGKKDIKK